MSPRSSSSFTFAVGDGGSMRRSCVGVVMVWELSLIRGISVWANDPTAVKANSSANQERYITMTSLGRWSRVLPRRRRWLRTLRRILVLIISLNGPKKLVKKALFLLVVFGIGGLGRLRRLSGLDRLTWDRSLDLLSGIRHRRRCGRLWTNSQEFLKEVALVASGHLARLARLSAGDECGRVIVGTDGCCQVICDLVESYFDHSRRWRKLLYSVFVLRKGNSPLHELCPDGGRALRALKA